MAQNYSKEIIEKFSNWIDDDANALEWLITFNYREFVLLREAVYGDSKAIQALLTTKQFVLAAFANAVWDDIKALEFLIRAKAFQWAAVANIINGDEKAQIWLKKNELDYYIPLAYKIQKEIRRSNSKFY